MDNIYIDAWIAALRSGEYEQTTECLQDRCGYCCLGVGADVVRKIDHLRLPKDAEGFLIGSTLGDNFYRRVTQRLGLKSAQGYVRVTRDIYNKMRDVIDPVKVDRFWVRYEPRTFPRRKARAIRIALSDLNDTYDFTFEDIANLLELEPEFVESTGPIVAARVEWESE